MNTKITVTPPGGLIDIAVSADGTRVYAEGSSDVYVIDVASNTVIGDTAQRHSWVERRYRNHVRRSALRSSRRPQRERCRRHHPFDVVSSGLKLEQLARLTDNRRAVEPDVLPTDQPAPELEPVQDAEADLATESHIYRAMGKTGAAGRDELAAMLPRANPDARQTN